MESRTLYNSTAKLWSRKNPNSLSDFTARPFIFEWAGNLEGQIIGDFGCGEGYCSRTFVKLGADKVYAFDESEEMVAGAKNNTDIENQKVDYQVASITEVPFSDNFFDQVFAVFVFNYLTIEDSVTALKEIYRVLKPGGKLLLSHPHPAFSFIREGKEPFFFDVSGDYFSARNTRHHGEIHCIDGKKLKVQMVHKTMEDIFTALAKAQFSHFPKLKELTVTEEIESQNPNFFSSLKGVPLHYMIQVEK